MLAKCLRKCAAVIHVLLFDLQDLNQVCWIEMECIKTPALFTLQICLSHSSPENMCFLGIEKHELLHGTIVILNWSPQNVTQVQSVGLILRETFTALSYKSILIVLSTVFHTVLHAET